jgi:hypothetical protein
VLRPEPCFRKLQGWGLIQRRRVALARIPEKAGRSDQRSRRRTAEAVASLAVGDEQVALLPGRETCLCLAGGTQLREARRFPVRSRRSTQARHDRPTRCVCRRPNVKATASGRVRASTRKVVSYLHRQGRRITPALGSIAHEFAEASLIRFQTVLRTLPPRTEPSASPPRSCLLLDDSGAAAIAPLPYHPRKVGKVPALSGCLVRVRKTKADHAGDALSDRGPSSGRISPQCLKGMSCAQ